MIFCRTQIAVDRLMRILRRDNYPVEAIHGSLGQGQRERVIADFRRGAVSLLIATVSEPFRCWTLGDSGSGTSDMREVHFQSGT